MTKIHHTHSCQFCGLTWRPCIEPTVGVRFLPGFKSHKSPPIGTLIINEDAIWERLRKAQENGTEWQIHKDTQTLYFAWKFACADIRRVIEQMQSATLSDSEHELLDELRATYLAPTMDEK